MKTGAKKAFVAMVVAGAIVPAFATSGCLHGFKKAVSKKIPRGFKVSVKLADKKKEGIKLPGGWVAYTVETSFIAPNGKVAGSEVTTLFCNDEDRVLTLDLISYSGKVWQDEIKSKKIPELLKRFEDRALNDGKGRGSIVIFSDPLCPYCQEYVPQVLRAAERLGKKIYYFGVALKMHPDAPKFEKIIEYGLSKVPKGADRIGFLMDAYYTFDKARNFSQLKEKDLKELYDRNGIDYPGESVKDIARNYDISKKLQENEEAMKVFGAKGTPAVFDGYGNKVDIAKLLKLGGR